MYLHAYILEYTLPTFTFTFSSYLILLRIFSMCFVFVCPITIFYEKYYIQSMSTSSDGTESSQEDNTHHCYMSHEGRKACSVGGSGTVS